MEPLLTLRQRVRVHFTYRRDNRSANKPPSRLRRTLTTPYAEFTIPGLYAMALYNRELYVPNFDA